MPINKGTTPPTINGVYNLDPMTLKNTNIPDDYAIGTVFNDLRTQFTVQNNTLLTVNVETVSVNSSGAITSTAIGNGSFIVGNGQNFTVFGKVVSTHDDGTITDMAIILSGTLTANSISNYYYSLFMLDNHNRSDLYILNGQGRVFWDSDGVSEKILSLRAAEIMTKASSAGVTSPDRKKIIH